MGKHPKSKTNGAKNGSASRPEPYAKKAKVEVKFEGQPSGKSTVSTKSSKPPAPSTSSQTKQPSAKSKGKAKAIAEVIDTPLTPQLSNGSFVIVAGSYEKLLYGIEGTYAPGADRPTLKPIFIFPAHLACVKAVAASASGKWLASGSEDEFVKVWDLRRRKEVGSLSQHTGSITSLHFPTSSHLITTSEDSTLSLFRTSDWALLKSLKGHSGRVNHVDVHPTGRVALSVGKDKTLKMWDLMRGRGAASLPLGSEAEMVKFSPLGTHFAVLYPKKVEIYSLTLKLLKTITGSSRFNTLLFTLVPGEDEEETEVMCVGNEKGLVEVYTVELAETVEEESEDEEEAENTEKKEENGAEVERIGAFTGHTNRVKSISVLPYSTPASDDHPSRELAIVSSVSTDGFINVYELTSLLASRADQAPLASYDTKGSRLTVCCLAEGKKAGQVIKAAVDGSAGASLAGDDEDDDEDDSEIDDEEDIYGSSADDDDDEEDDQGMEVEFEDDDDEEELEFEDEEE